MANALFLASRWTNDASVTASSAQGLLTADKVQSIDPTEVWRATGCAAEYLAWDYGSDVECDCAILTGHNLSPTATLRLRLAASAAGVTAAPAVDSGVVSAWPSSGKPDVLDWFSWFSLVLATNSAGYRYGRLDVADPANPDGFVQAARLFAGPSFVPLLNVDINPSLGLMSPDEVGRTPFGHFFGDTRGPAARVMAVPMSALTEAEMGEELFELQRYCGLARDFAFCLDPAATTTFYRYAMQARFASLQPFQLQRIWNEVSQLWQTTLPLEEVT